MSGEQYQSPVTEQSNITPTTHRINSTPHEEDKKQNETKQCNQCFAYHSNQDVFPDKDGVWYCVECWFDFSLTLPSNHSQTGLNQRQACTKAKASTSTNNKNETEPIDFLYNQIPIKLASNASSLKSIVVELLSLHPLFIGIDLEWKPVFVKGAPKTKAALFQIATQELIVLIQLQQLQNVYDAFHTSGLLKLMMDTTVLKSGVGIIEDQQKLYNDYGITVMKCIELNNLNLWPINKFGQFKLKDLCPKVLGWKMQYKLRKITMSNWEKTQLSEKQILYAAEDAFVSYRVLDEMLIKNDMYSIQMLKRIAMGEMDLGIGSNYAFDRMERFRKDMIKIGINHAQFSLSVFRDIYATTCKTMFMYNGKLSKLIVYFDDIFSYNRASCIVISKIYKKSK